RLLGRGDPAADGAARHGEAAHHVFRGAYRRSDRRLAAGSGRRPEQGVSAATLFITGTDAGVGKTHVACALLRALRREKLKVCGFKPVASGCERTPQGLRNADALALQEAAGTREAYERINPYAFDLAIAPHLA